MAYPAVEPLDQKQHRYQEALDVLVERLKTDRQVLAVVLVGSLDQVVIWRKEAIQLWLVEADGVSRRHRSDGEDERLFRTLVCQGIRFHVEMIPRSRFKRMVEGTSRTAFTHSFFAHRSLLYSTDRSLTGWFGEAQSLSTHDQRRELLVVAGWAVYHLRRADKRLHQQPDLELCRGELMHLAWCMAALEVVTAGEVWEREVIYRGAELNPELMRAMYFDLLKGPAEKNQLSTALKCAEIQLAERQDQLFVPLLRFLKKQPQWVALSELGDQFAHTQLYPWHLEAACEWLADRGVVERFSAPYRLTQKSRVEMEEPAYLYEG